MSELMAALAELYAETGARGLVLSGVEDLELARAGAQLSPQTFVLDHRPGRLRELAGALAEQGLQAHCHPGAPWRSLQDLQLQIPERSVYLLAHPGLDPDGLRHQLYHLPRNQGAVLILDAERAAVADQLYRWAPSARIEDLQLDGHAVVLARTQAAVHVTFLIEKYTHAYKDSGLSINLDNCVATLHQAGLASYDVVHYDERYHEGPPLTATDLAPPPGCDLHLICTTVHYHSPANPEPALLRQAQAQGSKVCNMWLDKKTSCDTPEYAELADINLLFDGADFELPRAWPIFTPKNPVHFYRPEPHHPDWERDIDFCVLGESRHLGQRKDFIARLREETRIPVHIVQTSAADTGRMLSVAEYARYFQRSKISLCLTKDRVRQLKGRIFETVHCGAMLLCDSNPYINTYLRPGAEYVPFRDYEDMVGKVAHFLADDAARRRIADAGHARANQYYNSQVFWRSLLLRAGQTWTSQAARPPALLEA